MSRAPTSGRRPVSGASEAPVAVVGAGCSGTLVAVHLARLLPPERGVLLCERAPAFGQGLAYAAGHPDHLLNVRAGNMSAFADRPAHFDAWLEAVPSQEPGQVHITEVGIFASRRLYGRYLAELLAEAVTGGVVAGRLQQMRGRATALRRTPDGFDLAFADGSLRRVSACVLAIGNLAASRGDTAMVRQNPWSEGSTAGLRPDLPVLIVGTGLTMVDLAVEIFARGVPGPVIALSRRGLLPHRHAPSSPWPTLSFSTAERSSLRALVRRVRDAAAEAEVRGGDWRGVVDSLRPLTQDLWRGLPQAERARFLRHMRSFWDIHRHRMAPPVADMVDAMRQSGFLQTLRGRVLGIDEHADCAEVTWQPHGAAPPRRLTVQRVIMAVGSADASRTEEPLVRSLLGDGMARLDPLGLGLEVTDALQVVDAEGAVAPGLWALGPIVRGVFWECTAVPDIRGQAERVARAVAGVP
jgi:uncharacterized NAD(P)/FAD-binding protein YdhS